MDFDLMFQITNLDYLIPSAGFNQRFPLTSLNEMFFP